MKIQPVSVRDHEIKERLRALSKSSGPDMTATLEVMLDLLESHQETNR